MLLCNATHLFPLFQTDATIRLLISVSLMSVSAKLYDKLHGQVFEDHSANITEIPGGSDATE